MFALAVLITAAGGLPETVTEGETGLLVPTGDAPALTQALERLLSDPALCQAMGAAGRRRNASRFDWDMVGDHIADIATRLVRHPEPVS